MFDFPMALTGCYKRYLTGQMDASFRPGLIDDVCCRAFLFANVGCGLYV